MFNKLSREWHSGLLYTLKNFLPTPYYLFLKSYLSDEFFFVKHNNVFSSFNQIKSGVPQSSELGSILYTIYTSDLPTSNELLVATYATFFKLIPHLVNKMEYKGKLRQISPYNVHNEERRLFIRPNKQ